MAKHAAKAKHSTAQSNYVAALDGLRAFAVLAVIAYHMGLDWAPGGLMGVTVFFVISGYLINGLLVAERQRTGTIDLKAFWLRRIRRLFPAIVLAIVGTAALCTLFNSVLLDKMRPDIVPSLLFYNNWWQIFHDVSYFENAGAPSPLTHFWSLSIEEQFYLVWPLLLVAMYALGMKKRSMAGVALGLAVLSAVAMAALYDPTGDPSRIYYGTDTRAMSLLLGVWLAFVLPSAAFGTTIRPERWRRVGWIAANLGGILAFGALVLVIVFTSGFTAFPYLGGVALTSVLSVAVISVLVLPGSWLGRVLSFPAFVYIGKRSYGMYLWHLPLLLLTTNANSASETPWWTYVAQLALIVLVAELSYRFVEDPIRKRKLQTWIAQGASGRKRASNGAVAVRVAVPTACFVGILVVAVFGIVTVPAGIGSATIQQAVQHQPVQKPERPPSEEEGEADLTTYKGMFLTPRSNEAGGPVYEPLLIGDSVSLGAEEQFYEAFPYGNLDSVVSRNIWESSYRDYLASDSVGEFVVFCLGTNNAVEDGQIDDLLQPVSDDKQVIMVNTRSTTSWFQGTNEAIARTPSRHPNVTVIDWYAASEGHEEYFAGDGTHLTEDGARAYINQIQYAVAAAFERTNGPRLEAKAQAERLADAKWNVSFYVRSLWM